METKHLQIHDLANVLALIDGAAKQGLVAGISYWQSAQCVSDSMLN